MENLNWIFCTFIFIVKINVIFLLLSYSIPIVIFCSLMGISKILYIFFIILEISIYFLPVSYLVLLQSFFSLVLSVYVLLYFFRILTTIFKHLTNILPPWYCYLPIPQQNFHKEDIPRSTKINNILQHLHTSSPNSWMCERGLRKER